jgi:hypothetical protein
MKVDLEILFLIAVIGIISAGIVTATVINHDPSMKDEVFDGIKVSVPADSNFIKVGDGIYKDSNNGITIRTFKNNDSISHFLKNAKKAKVIPLENQPPQSIAYKTGDVVSVLVTNGNEGIAISTKDPKLTAEMGNNVVFSNNHKSAKSSGINIVRPQMSPKQDFNLIIPILADVDTKIFNTAIFENVTISVVDEYNANISEPINIIPDETEDAPTVSEAADNGEFTEVLDGDSNSANSNSQNSNSASNDGKVETVSQDSNSAEPAGGDTVEQVSSDGPSASPNEPADSSNVASSSSGSSSSSPSSSPSGSSSAPSSQPSELSAQDCMKIAEQKLGPSFQIIGTPDETSNSYIFHYEGPNHQEGKIEISKIDGSVIPNQN